MKENKNIKWLLIIQSFTPLFILVFIKVFSFDRLRLIGKFFWHIRYTGRDAFVFAFEHNEIWSVILIIISIIYCVACLIIYAVYDSNQEYGFIEEKHKIIIESDITENSTIFFMTYIIPLVLDDVNESRGFISFFIIVFLLALLMRNTNLYYQNPILTIWGYKSYRYHLEGENGESSIGITKGFLDKNKLIKRKLISDNVYLIYNKN